MNEHAQYIEDNYAGGLQSYVESLYQRAQEGSESNIDDRVVAEIQRLGGQVDYAKLNVSTATGTNGSNVQNTGLNTNNTTGATTLVLTTSNPATETNLRDEYGNTMPVGITPQSGFQNIGLLDDIKGGAGSIWDTVTEPIKNIFQAFSTMAEGLKLLVAKFVSLGLWWLPVFFVGYFLIKFLRLRAGGRYVSIGGR